MNQKFKVLTTEDEIEKAAMIAIRSMPMDWWIKLKDKLTKVITENPQKITMDDLCRLFALININRRLTVIVIAHLKLTQYLKPKEKN
jgi:hypothetical protein